MKKILLVTAVLFAAATWYLAVQSPDPVTSPTKKKPQAVKGIDKKKGKGSKGISRVRPRAPQKSSGAVLSSDCLEKKEATACKKTKGGKKLTSPTPLSKKPGSLEEGSYSRLPE